MYALKVDILICNTVTLYFIIMLGFTHNWYYAASICIVIIHYYQLINEAIYQFINHDMIV